MSTIVSIHSFRGGTGKSNLTANLASSLIQQGKRVAMVDTDIQSPGIHVLGCREPEATSPKDLQRDGYQCPAVERGDGTDGK